MEKILHQVLLAAAILFLPCLTACLEKKPAITIEQVRQENLDERIALWQSELEKKCQEQVLERAAFIVDSTIIANARLQRDSSNLVLPPRPTKPDFTPPIDTIPVRPVIPKKRDTIQ